MINYLNLWRTITSRILFGFLVLGSACKSSIQETYCYKVNSTIGDEPRYFEIHKIYQQKNRRIDSVFFLDRNFDTLVSYSEIYEVRKHSLFRLMEGSDKSLRLPFLSTETRDCIHFLPSGTVDELAKEYCYLGTEEIKIGNRTYKDAYKFKETELFSGLLSVVYFDRNFIRLKQTYITDLEPNINVELAELCVPTK
ncbi:hypothetical protein [Mariniradius saccharolyticus]|uniref:hypothetical protein n=1 Tax=Mariniradius saccharolyticus TaxID=1245591 RepID=UPI00058CF0BC|nr:hypothetical protein [Mariniradius saccharolyticus]